MDQGCLGQKQKKKLARRSGQKGNFGSLIYDSRSKSKARVHNQRIGF